MWKTILISFLLFMVAFIFGRIENKLTKLNRLNELERRMKNGKKN